MVPVVLYTRTYTYVLVYSLYMYCSINILTDSHGYTYTHDMYYLWYLQVRYLCLNDYIHMYCTCVLVL